MQHQHRPNTRTRIKPAEPTGLKSLPIASAGFFLCAVGGKHQSDADLSPFDTFPGRFDTFQGRFDTFPGRFDTFPGRFDTSKTVIKYIEQNPAK